MFRTPRIVPRQPSARSPISWRGTDLLAMLRSYFGLGADGRLRPIDTPEALAEFIDTRSSYMAQTSLYGYLRTRMGMRYPELFDDDVFVVGINIAKWEIWLDCVSDLSVHAGARIAQKHPSEHLRLADMMKELVDALIRKAGKPNDCGPDFVAHGDEVRDRISRTHWLAIGEYEAAFKESPASVVRWAPIAEELKVYDEEIVRNSVRFHWQEIRRDFARHIRPAAVLALRPPDAPPQA